MRITFSRAKIMRFLSLSVFFSAIVLAGCNYMPEISMPSLSVPAVTVEPEVEPELCQIGENVFFVKGDGDCPQYPAEN